MCSINAALEPSRGGAGVSADVLGKLELEKIKCRKCTCLTSVLDSECLCLTCVGLEEVRNLKRTRAR